MKGKATMLAENLAVAANATAITANVMRRLGSLEGVGISELDTTLLNERIAKSFAQAVRKQVLVK